MAPASLDHADFRIGEEMDCSLEKVRLWNEIRIQNTNEFALRGSQSRLEGACFEPGAIGAVNEFDIESAALQFRHAGAGQLPGIVGGIIENLDLEEVLGIIYFANRSQKTFDDIHFIENGQLHRPPRQLVKLPRGHRSLF